MRNNQNRLGQKKSPASSSEAAAQSQNNLSYVVPTEFVELPSRGLFYPEGHPLHGQDTVEIKYMTAKEEDILSSLTLIKKGVVLDRLMERLLIDKTIDPTSLVIGDRNVIMLAARISAYGNEYETRVTCPACNTTTDHSFDLKKQEIKGECFNDEYLNENEIQLNEDTKTFSLKLPVSQMTVELGILSLNHLEGKDDSDSPVTSALAAFITSVNGETNRNTIQSFVESMPAKDSRHLRKIYTELAPNVDLTNQFYCVACFHREEMEVPLNAEFFWPR
jgi:hypothetical protein